MSDGAKEYWETGEESPGTHLVHWGALGTRGESRNVESTFFRSAEKIIQREIDGLVAQGFRPISPEDHAILLIEYQIDGMGTGVDLDKRHTLEGRMNETLGW